MNEYLIDSINKKEGIGEKLSFLKEHLLIEGYDCSICDEMKEFQFEDKAFNFNEMIYATILAKDSIVYPKNNNVDSYILEMLFRKENKYHKIDFNNLYYLFDLADIDTVVSDLILSKFDSSISIDTVVYTKIINDQLKDSLLLFKEMSYLKDYILHRLISYLLYYPNSDVKDLVEKYKEMGDVEEFSSCLMKKMEYGFKSAYPVLKKITEKPIVFFEEDDTLNIEDTIYLDDSLCYSMLNLLSKSGQEAVVDEIITLENQGEGCFILYLACAYPEKIETLKSIIEVSRSLHIENQTTYTSLILLLFAEKNLDSFLLNCAKQDVLHDESVPFYMYLGLKDPNMTQGDIIRIKTNKYNMLEALFLEEKTAV